MGNTIVHDSWSIGKHCLAFLAMLTAGIALYFAAAAPSAFAAENFCATTLQPYGHSGDRCWGASRQLRGVGMTTFERAGCVDIANGSNELLRSWQCTGANSISEIVGIQQDGVNRKGVIRNNNLSFAGSEFCYIGC
jgi:hypothetical protein